MAFLTEKKIEKLLLLETRTVPMPDGSQKAFSFFKVWWNAYDIVVWTSGFYPKKLAALAQRNAEITNIPYEKSLHDVVYYILGEQKRFNGD